MDIALIGGILLGFVSLITAFVLEGGHIKSLFVLTAAMIVFGGTIGATMAGFSMKELKELPSILGKVFKNEEISIIDLIKSIYDMAGKARKEGLISLEPELEKIDYPLLKKGLQLVVDAASPELVKNSMELSIYAAEQRHKIGISIFESAGGYAPTMGIIGTVMGLVHVLSNLSEPEKLGPSIAVAFIATLYGVSSANLLWFPIANKLKYRSKQEMLAAEIVLEGVLAIQAGENPIFIESKLSNFLRNKDWEKSRSGGKNQ